MGAAVAVFAAVAAIMFVSTAVAVLIPIASTAIAVCASLLCLQSMAGDRNMLHGAMRVMVMLVLNHTISAPPHASLAGQARTTGDRVERDAQAGRSRLGVCRADEASTFRGFGPSRRALGWAGDWAATGE